MDCYWYISQAGIAVEFVGAFLGVFFALRTRRNWTGIAAETYGGIGVAAGLTQKEFTSQYGKQMAAFGLIGIGLVLQFVGNFGSR